MTALILPKLGNCKDFYEAEAMLMSMGAQRCGSGHFASVFRVEVYNPDEFICPPAVTYKDFLLNAVPSFHKTERTVRIIKVTRRRDNGALVVAKAAMACATVDPMAPVYYGITEWSSGAFMAEMEPLTLLRDMDHHAGLTGSPKGCSDVWEQKRTPLPEAIAASPFLTLLNHYVGKGYKWDLHSQNVMMRGDQPVITDPMYLSSEA